MQAIPARQLLQVDDSSYATVKHYNRYTRLFYLFLSVFLGFVNIQLTQAILRT